MSTSPLLPSRAAIPLAIAIALTSLSCAEEGANFSLKSAEGFQGGRTTVSVLGVFRDGRMNADAWSDFTPRLSAALGQKACEAGYGAELQQADPELYAAVDDDTRTNGVTEELLEKLAPSAEGDVILALSAHGGANGPLSPRRPGEVQHVAAAPRRGRGAGTMPGAGNMPTAGPPMTGQLPPQIGEGEIVISGSLFSVKYRRSMARLTMVYSGTNLDDAVQKFTRKLLTGVIPGSTCRGWKFVAPAAATAPPAALPSGTTPAPAPMAPPAPATPAP